jgi:hypothetical protein
MSDLPDVSHIRFSSTVFPSREDMKLWDSLTLEQKKAVERREVQKGVDSGLAEPCSMAEIIAEAKAEMKTT